MKSTSRRKNTATLSNVLSIITNCLFNAGINRTNLSILNRRKVRKTDRPEPLSFSINSITLEKKERKFVC